MITISISFFPSHQHISKYYLSKPWHFYLLQYLIPPIFLIYNPLILLLIYKKFSQFLLLFPFLDVYPSSLYPQHLLHFHREFIHRCFMMMMRILTRRIRHHRRRMFRLIRAFDFHYFFLVLNTQKNLLFRPFQVCWVLFRFHVCWVLYYVVYVFQEEHWPVKLIWYFHYFLKFLYYIFLFIFLTVIFYLFHLEWFLYLFHLLISITTIFSLHFL